MGLETGSYISDLVSTNPVAADPKSQGDDHLRLIKATVKATFPNISGAVTPTHTELNYMVGATTNPAMKDGSNLTTPTLGDSSTKIATTAFVAGTAFASTLPAQTGNAGKFITTDGTTASWASLGVTRSARTSNTILSAADHGTLIDITSGTFTQTFTASATIGSGWWCYIRNSGTGEITLDPNASETIDGLSSYVMYPCEARLVQCTGTELFSVVLSPFVKLFTTTGTFTKPPGYSYFGGIGWGGGASGARTNATLVSRGGGGGMSFPFQIASSKFGSSETITIGAGGLAYTGTSGSTHNAGGDTSIGSLLTINGATSNVGAGFGAAVVSPVGFEGGSNSSGSANYAIYGGGGCNSNPNSNSGNSRYGGGAGGGCDSGGTAYNGGVSIHGGDGGNASSAANGVDGVAPGGGGGATQTGTQSGAGARGELRIWGVA